MKIQHYLYSEQSEECIDFTIMYDFFCACI